MPPQIPSAPPPPTKIILNVKRNGQRKTCAPTEKQARPPVSPMHWKKNREFTTNACHANLTNMQAYFVTKIDKVYKIHLQNLVFILKKLIKRAYKEYP